MTSSTSCQACLKIRMTTKKLVLFGAGNIGRSFIGQLFSRAGYEIVFIDVNDTLINALNERREYRIIIKRNDQPDETIVIENARGVHGKHQEEVCREIASASILATAVGKGALPHILPTLAEGLKRRRRECGDLPIDMIMAENYRNISDYVRENLRQYLPPDYPLQSLVGLVETSIGKMVPIMKDEDVRHDPLWVFAEAYNELILDKYGFKNPIPDVPGMAPKENMQAYVDRKLFIHNLGHAATAYFGYQQNPAFEYIYEPLAHLPLFEKVRATMLQSAVALNKAYPADLTMPDLIAHIDDLLERFRNRALGDTIFRVGRDLPRKLEKNDRLVGAMLMSTRQHCPCDLIAEAVVAACHFRAADEHGKLFPADDAFASRDFPAGLDHILANVCHLSAAVHEEAAVMAAVQLAFHSSTSRP